MLSRGVVMTRGVLSRGVVMTRGVLSRGVVVTRGVVMTRDVVMAIDTWCCHEKLFYRDT